MWQSACFITLSHAKKKKKTEQGREMKLFVWDIKIT